VDCRKSGLVHHVTDGLVNPSTRTAPCFRLSQFLTQSQKLPSRNQSSSLVTGLLSQVRNLKGVDGGWRKGPMDGCDYTPVVTAIGGVLCLFDAPQMVVRVRQSLSNGSLVAIRRKSEERCWRDSWKDS
jgi:hypothetical protein